MFTKEWPILMLTTMGPKVWETYSCDQEGGTVRVTPSPAFMSPHSPPIGHIYVQFLSEDDKAMHRRLPGALC